MRNRTILKDVSLLAGENLAYIDDGWIVIEKGIIVDYGTGRMEEGIALPGALLIPAFIDAHTHIGDTAAKEAGVGMPTIKAVSPPNGMKYRIIRAMSEDEHIESIRHGAAEYLNNGIAAFGDFREEGLFGIEKVEQALEGLPLQAVLFGEPAWDSISGDGGHEDGYERDVEKIIEKADGIGIGDVADFSEERLAFLAELLRGKGKVLAVHAGETRAAQMRCRELWDKGEIERVLPLNTKVLLVHVTNPSPEEIELIGKKRAPVVLCPRTNAILSDGIPPIGDFIKRNIPFAIGTDNMMFTAPDIFREMDFLSRIGRAEAESPDLIVSKEVLKAATIHGAAALGLQDLLGSVDKGKKASFLLLDLETINLRYIKDPYSAIVHRASREDIAQRWYDGRVYPVSAQPA